MYNFNNATILCIVVGIISLLFAYSKSLWINKQDIGSEKTKEIGEAIRVGSMAFLRREYRILILFVIGIAILLFIINKGSAKLTAVSFIIGAFCSGLAGFFGMRVATAANTRTTTAAINGLSQALNIAFSGGSVMGLSVVGLGLIGLSSLLLIFSHQFGGTLSDLKTTVLPIVGGFAMGASSIALFARVGGGIYTKAADVGADLVGKVEAGIPEDDPRNPATIADNVGDNVGDVAGMGADLFESYIGSILGAMILGAAVNSIELVGLPLLLAAQGIIISILGTFFVRTKEGGNPQLALNTGTFGAGLLMLICSYPLVMYFGPEGGFTQGGKHYSNIGIFWSVVMGLITGIAIGLATEYYTGTGKKPVNNIALASKTGSATNIIAGLGVGMKSTTLPILFLSITIISSYHLAGLFGIAVAAIGMLATTGIQLAVDAYGPIADNAGGIAEMSNLPPEVRQRTDNLDAVGNTTAAIGKGFAIGSAALTSIALFVAFKETADITKIDVTEPFVMVGLLIGGMLPFLFSSMAMRAVGESAYAMIEEVRRQFKEIPGLLAGKQKADFAKCVDISTTASLKGMVLPGLLAILTPVVIGFVFNKTMLGGVLAGVTVTGVMMALFMSNAGGAWDNAKKTIESGVQGGKNSEAHKAAVTGDTVGDPFKDTAGPALNILIKLMAIVSLVIAPLIK